MSSEQVPGWEGTVGPFPGQYRQPHVYARDIHSGAGNCVCGLDLGAVHHVQAAPGVEVPVRLRQAETNPYPSDVGECGRLAISLARAAESDDPAGQVAWDAATAEEQAGAMYILALWTAQLRDGLDISWDVLSHGIELLAKAPRNGEGRPPFSGPAPAGAAPAPPAPATPAPEADTPHTPPQHPDQAHPTDE